MKAPQVIYDLPEELYHGDLIEAGGQKQGTVSRGEITDMFRYSPWYLRCKLDGKIKPKESDALTLGTLAHTAILNPTKPTFRVIPKTIERKSGNEWKSFSAACKLAGLIPIWEEEFDAANAMRDSVRRHVCELPQGEDKIQVNLGELLDHPETKTEVSGYADHFTGIRRRCRWDCLPGGSNVILDLKTVGLGGAAMSEFAKSVADWEYHIQAAWYLDIALDCSTVDPVCDRALFWFVCVEKEPPYQVAVHSLDRETLMTCRKEYERRLGVYRDCVDRGYWPSYGKDVLNIGVPPWGFKGYGSLEGGH